MTVYRSIRIPWYQKLEAGPSWHKIYVDMLLLFKTIQVIRIEKPDIIHAHLHEGAFLGLICRGLFRIPMIADFQGSLVGELLDHRFIRHNKGLYKTFKYIEHKIHQFSKSMITSSRQAADLIKKSYLFDHERMIPVEDGVNLERFVPMKPVHGLRKKLGIKEDKKIVIYVGILNEYQGIDYLLEAIRLIKDDSIHFLIVGFPEESYIEKAKALDILPRTTFTGRVSYEQIPDYLSIADVGISPKTSESEANGKLLEYMAMGIPTIVFDSFVNKEILGDCGSYARMRDSASLAQTVKETVGSLNDNETLKSDLRKRAEELFSWESKVDTIEKLYEKKLSNTSKS